MSQKADRGTKRTCQSCSAKFYDLNRAEVSCPICGAVYQREAEKTPVESVLKETKPAPVAPPPAAPTVEAKPAATDEIEEEADELAEIADDATEIEADATDDNTFLEDDEDGEADVTGIIGGGLSEKEDET